MRRWLGLPRSLFRRRIRLFPIRSDIHGGRRCNKQQHAGSDTDDPGADPMRWLQLSQELDDRRSPLCSRKRESMLQSPPRPPMYVFDRDQPGSIPVRRDGGCITKRMPTGEQLIRHTRESKHIVSRVRGLTEQHLRACIGWRQRTQRGHIEAGRVRASICFWQESPGNTEVQHFYRAVERANDVRRLEIRMNDAFAMRMSECGAGGMNDPQHFGARQAASRATLDQRIQRATFQQLHHQKHRRAIAIEIEHARNVRMGQRLRFLGLALQRLERLRMLAKILVQHFHRDERIAILSFLLAQIARLEHRAHAAAPDLFFENETFLEHGAEPDIHRRHIRPGRLASGDVAARGRNIFVRRTG